MKSLRYHLLATAAALIAACAMTTAPAALAAETAHDHAGATPSRLALDHGRKWSTDAGLRSAMERIRTVVASKLPAAHEGKLGAGDYAALAGQVESEIGTIVANCKLEPKADAMLHVVIGDIGAATDVMAGKNPNAKPQQGLVQVASAVNNYGKYFEHPGFKPIPVKH